MAAGLPQSCGVPDPTPHAHGEAHALPKGMHPTMKYGFLTGAEAKARTDHLMESLSSERDRQLLRETMPQSDDLVVGSPAPNPTVYHLNGTPCKLFDLLGPGRTVLNMGSIT
eukprot:c40359_g1_i1.p3 GENE.c40359_g1_i1~~c40359_g1_i1.p3  ORF type:complete len:123 (-),score=15.93 c40359_g1_i1:676-1011(-)